MDFKLFLLFVIISLEYAEAYPRHRGRYPVEGYKRRGWRRYPTFRSKGQGRRSRSRLKGTALTSLPYEAQENLKVEERMDVSLWKVDNSRRAARRARHKRSDTGRNDRAMRSRHQTPAESEPWPRPYNKTGPCSECSLAPGITVTLGPLSQTCPILTRALERHHKTLPHRLGVADQGQRQGAPDIPAVLALEVTVAVCGGEDFPGPTSDEAYTLSIRNSTCYLRSAEVWGALQGLVTLSQLLLLHPRGDSTQLWVKHTEVSDSPRYPHRGVVVDTAHTYLQPDRVITILDSMEAMQLNVLHWRYRADQLLPVIRVHHQLRVRTKPNVKGTYTGEDVRTIVEYARDRGIQVLPELVTIGCDVTGLLGATQLAGLLRGVYSVILTLFPGQSVHLGGQFDASCWSNDLLSNSSTEEGTKNNTILKVFTKRLLTTVRGLGSTRHYIMWDSVLQWHPQIDEDVTIQLRARDTAPVGKKRTNENHRTIATWCPDTSSADWLQELVNIASGATLEDSGIGGEVCMWGARVDNTEQMLSEWAEVSDKAGALWKRLSGAGVNVRERNETRGVP